MKFSCEMMKINHIKGQVDYLKNIASKFGVEKKVGTNPNKLHIHGTISRPTCTSHDHHHTITKNRIGRNVLLECSLIKKYFVGYAKNNEKTLKETVDN